MLVLIVLILSVHEHGKTFHTLVFLWVVNPKTLENNLLLITALEAMEPGRMESVNQVN